MLNWLLLFLEFHTLKKKALAPFLLHQKELVLFLPEVSDILGKAALKFSFFTLAVLSHMHLEFLDVFSYKAKIDAHVVHEYQ